MKIIVVDTATQSSIEVIADSTLSLPGRPVFLPDISGVGEWKAQPLLAVRICRLGKNVAEKFATRYFDALTVAYRLLPFTPSGMPVHGFETVADSTLLIGSWEPFTFSDSPLQVEACDTVTTISTALIPRAIVYFSGYATLKMGDILLLPLSLPLTSATISTTLTAAILSLTPHPLLSTRLK